VALIKTCPVCGTQNAASAQRCDSCGAMLTTVDLCEAREPGAAAPAPFPASETPPGGPRRCPHADCAQLNPPGAERCLYCNRPFGQAQAPSEPLRASIRWPWTEETEIRDCLLVGREAPAPAALAARLERDYGNVSRRHAELRVSDGALWLVDLGSRNGTFVDEARLAPHQPVRLANGATLRFAADLQACIAIRHGKP
jgi:hypothetical protein